jgi:hypothetical protein
MLSWIKAFFFQYVTWTWHHGLFDPWGGLWNRQRNILPIFLTLLPLLVVAYGFVRDVPLAWIGVVCAYGLQTLFVPEKQFVLGMLPFICIMAVGSTRAKKLPPWIWITAIPLLFLALPRLTNQLGLFGRPPYGLMDDYYYADILKKRNVQSPGWSNCFPLFYLMDWPVPGNDFLRQIEWLREIDWDQKPYSELKTIVYFTPSASLGFEKREGWTYEDVPLSRGQYKEVRIWQKK